MYLNVETFLLVLFTLTLSVEGTNTPKCQFPNGEHPEYFPHEDCGKFWQCSNGIPYLILCPNETHFNSNKNVCDWPQRAGCLEPAGITTDIPNASGRTEEEISEKCLAVNSTDVIYFSDNDCSKYWKCFNGFASAQKCPKGLLFNSELQVCDWPRNVVCDSETSLGPSTPSTVTVTTTVTTQIPPATVSDIPTSTTILPTDSIKPISSTDLPTSEETPPPTSDERCDDNDNNSSEKGKMLTTKICIPTDVTDIPSSFIPNKSSENTASTPLYTTSEYDTIPDVDFGTTEALIDITTEDNIESTSECSRPSNDSDEDDMASFSEEDEIVTTRKAETATEQPPPSTPAKNKDELIEEVCRNLPEDEFQAPHPFDCSKFLYCDNGYVTVTDCPADLWYDPLTRKCEYPNRGLCVLWRYERNVLKFLKKIL